MAEHNYLDIRQFKEEFQKTKTFEKIDNPAFKLLYFKIKTLNRFYENYRQGVRYGIDYLKTKPNLALRDFNIIKEILNLKNEETII